MKKCKKTIPVVVFLIVFTLGSTWFFNNPGASNYFATNRNDKSLLKDEPKFKDELDRVLDKTSMANKTLIITLLNNAYSGKNGMFDLFLESFQVGDNTPSLIKHILFVSADEAAYERCNLRGLNCYKLLNRSAANFSGEAFLLTENFLDMMWIRTQFVGEVLKRGYNLVSTDMDVLWFRNPFPYLLQGMSASVDMQVSCDSYNGNPWDTKNPVNTGFYYVVSNNRTMSLFDAWYAARNSSKGIQEQFVLEIMKNRGQLHQMGVTLRFLPTPYFALFCQRDGDFGVLRTVHAACCLTMKSKVDDLRVFVEEWKRYRKSRMPVAWPEYKACTASGHMVSISKHE